MSFAPGPQARLFRWRGWIARAACRDLGPDRFYGSDIAGTRPNAGRVPRSLEQSIDRATAKAKAVCDGCPVRSECLDYAIANREPFGVWGGMTTRERVAEIDRRHEERLAAVRSEYYPPAVVEAEAYAPRNAVEAEAYPTPEAIEAELLAPIGIPVPERPEIARARLEELTEIFHSGAVR